jgi:hypothetical protein
VSLRLTSQNLARRLERLEERHVVLNSVPRFVIVALDSDGQVSGRHRLTAEGLERFRVLTPVGVGTALTVSLARPIERHSSAGG